MRIFALLTTMIDQAVPTCAVVIEASIEKVLAQQATILASHRMLAQPAIEEMLVSLREELTWRARLGTDETGLKEAAMQWLAAQERMLHRLAEDRSQVEDAFFHGRPIDGVDAVSLDLSDRHDGAHSVAILTFVSGDRIVYKPRPLATESWFYRFLHELNGLVPPFSFAVLHTLDREGYGWVEFAAHRPSSDDAELRDYYRHAGALLCVLRLLRAGDCHFQNLIARGHEAIFIDAETLFHPEQSGEGLFTVADTAMLPSLQRSYDLGALSCVTPQQVVLDLPGLTSAPVTLVPRENLPASGAFSPELFVEQMAEGFAATWRFVCGHRVSLAELVASGRGLPIRMLPRDTPEYYRQMLLLALGRDTDPSLSAEELASLGRLEVPRFMATAGGLERESIITGLEAVLEELAALDEAGLNRQLKMLRLLWAIYGSMRGAITNAVKMAPV